jgi:hypothetical protein
MLFGAGRQAWRSVAGHFPLHRPRRKEGGRSHPAASFIFLHNRNPAQTGLTRCSLARGIQVGL